MALLDRVFYAQRLARVVVLGLAVGFAGVGLLVAPGGGRHPVSRAAIVLVFSSLAWAIGSLYSRQAPLPRRPLVGAAMQMLAGGLMLTVVGAASGEIGRVHPAAISLESWLGLAYLVGAGSLLGFTAYMWLLRAAPTSLVGTYAYVNPVVAVLLGTVLLGEPFTWRTLVGGGIILAAVALIVRTPRRAPASGARGPTGGRGAPAAANLGRHERVRPAQRPRQVGRGAPRGGRGRDRADRARRRALRRRSRGGAGRARGHARLDRLGARAAPVRAPARAVRALSRPTPSSRRPCRCASTRRRARTRTS